MMISRERIHAVLVNEDAEDRASIWYNRAMVVFIACSLVPLCFKEPNAFLDVVECVCVGVFIIDYLLRWATAGLSLKHGKASFAIYPLTPTRERFNGQVSRLEGIIAGQRCMVLTCRLVRTLQ